MLWRSDANPLRPPYVSHYNQGSLPPLHLSLGPAEIHVINYSQHQSRRSLSCSNHRSWARQLMSCMTNPDMHARKDHAQATQDQAMGGPYLPVGPLSREAGALAAEKA